MLYYVWEESGDVRPEPSYDEWRYWEEARWPACKVGDTFIGHGNRGVRVSTVFVGYDAGVFAASAPELWETLVFPVENGKRHSAEINSARYDSLTAALEGHERFVSEWTWWYEHSLGLPAEVEERTAYLHPAVAALRSRKQ